MGSDEREDEVREATDEMGRDGDEMEERLETLDEHIDEAQEAAANRPEAQDEEGGEIAGDWEDQSAGAQQGDDAIDAAGRGGSDEDR